MVHMASSQRSHRDEAKDRQVDVMGYVELLYPNIVVFVVLGHKSILIISFSINRTPRASEEVSIQSSLSHPLIIVAF
jgi:hypothetical protein